jgi:hypothetical protein
VNRWGLLLLGAGGGAFLGAQLGPLVTVPAVVVGGLGVVLLVLGARRGGSDLVGDAATSLEEPADPLGEGDDGRPTLKGLGNRVQRILVLAEEQAADRIAAAEAEAAQIVAEARLRSE